MLYSNKYGKAMVNKLIASQARPPLNWLLPLFFFFFFSVRSKVTNYTCTNIMTLDPQVVIAFSASWLSKDYSYSCTLNSNQSTHRWATMPLVSVQISVRPHILKPIVSTDITASLWDVFTGVRDGRVTGSSSFTFRT